MNHDSAVRRSTCNALLSKSGLYICGELTPAIEPTEVPALEIIFTPLNGDKTDYCENCVELSRRWVH